MYNECIGSCKFNYNTITTTTALVQTKRTNNADLILYIHFADQHDITEILLQVALNTITIILILHCLTFLTYILATLMHDPLFAYTRH
jgi:hypothetical protein